MQPQSATAKTILVIDDDARDREFIVESLRANGVSDNIVPLADGLTAMRYLAGAGSYADRALFPYPVIVITDLKMPNGDGFSVLEYMKHHPDYAVVPVLVLSGSDDYDDVKRAYRMGAACYLRKPQKLDDMRAALDSFYRFWSLCVVPQVDGAGRQIATEHCGKLGERFGRM